MIDARDTLLERMKVDLIGPEAPDELISDRPTDRYLTGILFPLARRYRRKMTTKRAMLTMRMRLALRWMG